MVQNDPTRNRPKPPSLSPVPEEALSYAASDEAPVVSTATHAPTHSSHTNAHHQDELSTHSPIPQERVQSFTQHTSLQRKRLRPQDNAHDDHRHYPTETLPPSSIPAEPSQAFTYHTTMKRTRPREENDSPLDHRIPPPPTTFTRAPPPNHQNPENHAACTTRKNYQAWRCMVRARAADANDRPRPLLLARQAKYKAKYKSEWQGW